MTTKLKKIGYTVKKDNGVDPVTFENSVGIYDTTVDAIVAFLISCASTGGSQYATWSEAEAAGYRTTRVRKEEI